MDPPGLRRTHVLALVRTLPDLSSCYPGLLLRAVPAPASLRWPESCPRRDPGASACDLAQEKVFARAITLRILGWGQ